MSYWHGDGLYVYSDGGEYVHLWVYRKRRPTRPPALTDGKDARNADMINGIRMPEALFEEFVISVAERLKREGKIGAIMERLDAQYPGFYITPNNSSDS